MQRSVVAAPGSSAAYIAYRFCCKSLFALSIKNSKVYRRDVRVNMWETSSPDDKLVSDLAKATEAIKIAARRSDSLMAGKLSPLNFGLLQQYLPKGDLPMIAVISTPHWCDRPQLWDERSRRS